MSLKDTLCNPAFFLALSSIHAPIFSIILMSCLTRTVLRASISLTGATQQDKTSPPPLAPSDPPFDCANITEGLFAIRLQCLVGLVSYCEAGEEEAHLQIIFSNILFPGSIGLVYIQHIKNTFCLICPDYQTI